MKKLCTLLAFFILNLAQPLSAQEAFVEGTDYKVVSSPYPATNEVLEFFSFSSPESYKMESFLAKLRKTLPAQVIVKQIPWSIGFRTYHAKAFYAADAMKISKAFIPSFFDAINAKHNSIDSDADVVKFFTDKLDVDEQSILKNLKSMIVQGKIERGKRLSTQMEVTYFPTFVINGKYEILWGRSYSDETLSNLIKFLLNKDA